MSWDSFTFLNFKNKNKNKLKDLHEELSIGVEDFHGCLSFAHCKPAKC